MNKSQLQAPQPSLLPVVKTQAKSHKKARGSSFLAPVVTTGWLMLQTLAGTPVWAAGEQSNLTYAQLLKDIDAGRVTSVELDPTQRIARVRMEGQKRNDPMQEVTLTEQYPELIQKLRTNRVEVDVQPSVDNSAAAGLLANLLLIFLLIAGLMLILRRSGAGPGQAMSFGKSRARFQMEAKTGIMFDDVAGIEEAKEELQEVVTFLKKPERFTAVGAKIPRGMLLVGRPGTGKTLLAKAIAGEAGVPFFSISGSEFVEMFVGVGASRVRDLFRKAKENAPCIVFIDEIDAVGRQRGVGMGGGNDEREQTLNQLLTEMDGFEGNAGVIVVAATNRPDVLDLALLRPGRFDRQIVVNLPTYKGRLGILEVHARTKKLAPEVSLEALAQRTPGFSGADLANLLNEAAILTARRRHEAITQTELNDAFDRVAIGITLKPLLDGKKKRLVAYHEVGHALLMTLLKHSENLDKVTIIPRSGGLGGFAMPLQNEENLDDLVQEGDYLYGKSRAWLLDNITVSLGGRAAEELVFGHHEVTVGASGDVKSVANVARSMVTRFGMSGLGIVSLENQNNNLYFGRDWPAQAEYSEDIARQIDHQVRTIVFQCHERALQLLQQYRPLIDDLVEVLVEQETIEGEQFNQMVAKYQSEAGLEPTIALATVG